VANSWGPHSGQVGFFMMPAAYIDLGYCNDMWSVPKKYA
jgi:C1A family cysteine protease